MLTKLRSLPSALYRCCLRPPYFVVRFCSNSPIVLPSISTASCFSVNGLRGVGIRILVGISHVFFIEGRTIGFELPRRQGLIFTRHHRHDDVRKGRPRDRKSVV